MTQATPSADAATSASKDESALHSYSVSLGSSGAAEAGSAPTREREFPDPSDTVLVDQAGRPLGPRALRTRRKILDATVTLLSEKPMRDMRVIDIARRIGSSPATFYQYFKDVEDVVLQLAKQMNESTPQLVELIGGDWEGREGHQRGCQIASMVIDHWEKYAPVLRARNNASDEGNLALRQERMAAMLPLVEAFNVAIERAHARAADEAGADEPSDSADEGAWEGGRVSPLVGATAISSCLERLSMYQGWIAELGGTREELVETTATLMQSLLTSRR
jgi:AcrR family transcriptional regulator